jgi:long-subunit fatty acid transport protein
MKKKSTFQIYVIIALTLMLSINNLYAQIEIPSSFNPVGSGARAIGMGGAFIGTADDATAASWNPGGLIQLEKPEFSIVFNYFRRSEKHHYDNLNSADEKHGLNEEDLNYLSLAYPFELLQRNMIVAITYQNLYEFNKSIDFNIKTETPDYTNDMAVAYSQKGRLSALGLSYCIQIVPQLSFGFTLNFWNDHLTHNHWTQNYTTHEFEWDVLDDYTQVIEHKTEEYQFKGFNTNIGFLWQMTNDLTMGFVLKTPFSADITHQLQNHSTKYYLESGETDPEITIGQPITDEMEETLKMPMSIGIGFSYDLSDFITVNADIYRTNWNAYTLEDEEGNERSPLSNRLISETDIDPTHQIRIGGEYRYVQQNYMIPFRCGIFYDPAPSDGKPDDFYGFSLGSGFSNKYVSIDGAYEYRTGNDVGESMMPTLGFSQDVEQHTLYMSMIVYLQ